MNIIKSFENSLNEEQKKQFSMVKELIYGYVMTTLVVSYDTQIRMELHKVSPITKPMVDAMKNVSDICKERYNSLEKLKNDLDLNYLNF